MYQRDLLPSYAGINTFARAARSTINELTAGLVAVAGVAHDGTSSSRQGVRQGPKSIREASADFIYDLQGSASHSMVNVLTGRTLKLPQETKLVDVGDLAVHPMDLERTMASCRDSITAILGKGAMPIILGGDHYITYPLAQGFKSSQGKSVGLIQLSSQLDLGDQDAVWGKDWHGATIRRLLDQGVVEGKNVAYIGTQGFIPFAEWDMAQSVGATVITADSAKEIGMKEAARQALDAAGSGCDSIYLSLDIDVVDSGFASGTGDVIIGGLTPAELLSLSLELSMSDKIGAIDVVEVAPDLDIRGRSQSLAAQAIIELIAPKVFAG